MTPLPTPLRPKEASGPLRVLIIGRISTVHQDAENIIASYRFVEDYLQRVYQGPIEITHLGERASGMLADRATIRQAEDLIDSGRWDLVVAEDLSRIFRNPRHQYNFVQDAVDADTRVICVGDNLDTADENWEIMMGAAALRHGTAIPDIRRRVRRTATHAFHRGGMVLKYRFGYRKLTAEEADSGAFGPKGLRIVRRPELTPVVRDMADRVLRGESYAAIAERLQREGIESPPYARCWSGRLVKQLLRDPLLSGTRTFRRTMHRPVYRTGRHRRLPNAEPERQHVPELAHLERAEHEQLQAAIAARERTYRHRAGAAHPLHGRPRRRAIWPAQHARCGICGGLMYCYGAFLLCRHARDRGANRCWNHVQVNCAVAREWILARLTAADTPAPAVRESLLSAAVELTRTGPGSGGADAALSREVTSLERQSARLTEAVARGGELDPLVTRLLEVTGKLARARERLGCLRARRVVGRPVLQNPNEEQLPALAAASFEFADLMRRLVPEFLVRPVQALDTPLIRPRAQLRLPSREMTGGASAGSASLLVDLFTPPAHIRCLPLCLALRREHPRESLKRLAARLSVSHMTVKRALDYARHMERSGLSEPYRELEARPERASRWV